MKNLLMLFLFVAVLLFSCSKEPCEDLQINLTNLEEQYDCVNTKYQMNIILGDQYTIIRNQDQFDQLVTGSCNAQIDFAMYDLLIGKKGLSNGNSRIEYELWSRCDEDNLQLEIDFFQNDTAEAPNLTYHALLDKLEDEQEVDVIIDVRFE